MEDNVFLFLNYVHGQFKPIQFLSFVFAQRICLVENHFNPTSFPGLLLSFFKKEEEALGTRLALTADQNQKNENIYALSMLCC